MNREAQALAVCTATAVVAAAVVVAVGHEARVCFCVFAVWIGVADWAGGRLHVVHRGVEHLAVPALVGVVRGIWWAAVAVAVLGVVLWATG